MMQVMVQGMVQVTIDALQVVINGLLVGLVYGLVAVSFVVIYRSSRIVNLAQGEILLIGALFIWTFTLGVKLPWGIGVPIALICCVGMALVLERALFRPLIGSLRSLFSWPASRSSFCCAASRNSPGARRRGRSRGYCLPEPGPSVRS